MTAELAPVDLLITWRHHPAERLPFQVPLDSTSSLVQSFADRSPRVLVPRAIFNRCAFDHQAWVGPIVFDALALNAELRRLLIVL
jgi:hypothetical protein